MRNLFRIASKELGLLKTVYSSNAGCIEKVEIFHKFLKKGYDKTTLSELVT